MFVIFSIVMLVFRASKFPQDLGYRMFVANLYDDFK